MNNTGLQKHPPKKEKETQETNKRAFQSARASVALAD